MPEQVFIKPSQTGLVVYYPDAPMRTLPEEGAYVTLNSYWRRVINRNDVTVVSQPGQGE